MKSLEDIQYEMYKISWELISQISCNAKNIIIFSNTKKTYVINTEKRSHVNLSYTT